MILNIFKHGYQFIKDSRFRIKVLDSLGFYNNMEDKEYLMKMYYCYFGKQLNLNNPQSFNEKLQWLKLYDRKTTYTDIVDKNEIKRIIERKFGKEYVIPNYGVWEKFEEIDFAQLPEKFVLKTTHDSGGVVICEDKSKFDFLAAKKKLEKSLKSNFYKYRREWPYKNVRPRIIAEMYISNNDREVDDYKVHCFNGMPKITLVCSDRFSKTGLTEDFYDNEWNHLNMKRPEVNNAIIHHEKPADFEKMLEMASILSKDYPFLRVDYYVIDKQIYVGELTLYPSSGFSGFEPESWDLELGKWISLPNRFLN
ncbi:MULTISPECIES: ATP-grasp fold amidoligase family protein [Clostridium]|uniref:ATP-grasp fold amidoligase family protein n=1 Tax=Clostridium TaxID=1485 RepID=UPI00290F66BA|nr:ATP-grasp fold amidoligase family protein [Clostridium sp.]